MSNSEPCQYEEAGCTVRLFPVDGNWHVQVTFRDLSVYVSDQPEGEYQSAREHASFVIRAWYPQREESSVNSDKTKPTLEELFIPAYTAGDYVDDVVAKQAADSFRQKVLAVLREQNPPLVHYLQDGEVRCTEGEKQNAHLSTNYEEVTCVACKHRAARLSWDIAEKEALLQEKAQEPSSPKTAALPMVGTDSTGEVVYRWPDGTCFTRAQWSALQMDVQGLEKDLAASMADYERVKAELATAQEQRDSAIRLADLHRQDTNRFLLERNDALDLMGRIGETLGVSPGELPANVFGAVLALKAKVQQVEAERDSLLRDEQSRYKAACQLASVGAEERVEALQDRVSALQADAARLEWLRHQGDGFKLDYHVGYGLDGRTGWSLHRNFRVVVELKPTVDAVIDEAMLLERMEKGQERTPNGHHD